MWEVRGPLLSGVRSPLMSGVEGPSCEWGEESLCEWVSPSARGVSAVLLQWRGGPLL